MVKMRKIGPKIKNVPFSTYDAIKSRTFDQLVNTEITYSSVFRRLIIYLGIGLQGQRRGQKA